MLHLLKALKIKNSLKTSDERLVVARALLKRVREAIKTSPMLGWIKNNWTLCTCFVDASDYQKSIFLGGSTPESHNTGLS